VVGGGMIGGACALPDRAVYLRSGMTCSASGTLPQALSALLITRRLSPARRSVSGECGVLFGWGDEVPYAMRRIAYRREATGVIRRLPVWVCM